MFRKVQPLWNHAKMVARHYARIDSASTNHFMCGLVEPPLSMNSGSARVRVTADSSAGWSGRRSWPSTPAAAGIPRSAD